MSQQPNALQATEALAELAQRRQSVVSQGPNERLIAFAWALFVLLFVPTFDFIHPAIAGGIISGAAVIGFGLTGLYCLRRDRTVKPRSNAWIMWVAWGVWYAIIWTVSPLFDERFGLIYTYAGVASALPLFVYSLWPRQRLM